MADKATMSPVAAHTNEGNSDDVNSTPRSYDMGIISDGVTDIPIIRQYAERIGATSRGMRKLVVQERRGTYLVDVAEVRFLDGGRVVAPRGYEPTDAEKAAIAEAWPRYKWPEYAPRPCAGGWPPHNPARFPFAGAGEDNLAIFWDQKGEAILMVEERHGTRGKSKTVLLWTPWSDGKWRVAEPPERLPLFGLETIGGAATIFVHEGPKAAKAMQRLIADDGRYEGVKRVGGWRDHPWGEFLGGGRPGAVAHVAWAGGAMRPEATDFAPLKASGAQIIFVADNDWPGVEAIKRISKSSRMKMSFLRFNQEWPVSFDLGDPFPTSEKLRRILPHELIRPATWSTDVVAASGRGRPSYFLRPEAAEGWQYTVSPALYFHSDYPGKDFTESEVDALLGPFSDAAQTARLIRKVLNARADGVAYRPGEPRIIQRGTERLVNLWTPCRIREVKGSAMLFGRLLVALFPVREERKHVARWGATLIACPRIRILFALLLRSETQGIGKSTLAEILAELLGQENVSRPSEAALTEGSFNSHLAKKRLIIVDEIYSRHTKKTYNKLKSPITDKTIRVNEKYRAEYEIDNFAHFVFSSNDLVAMLIDDTDRRFFIPQMSERKLSPRFWNAFHAWLKADGLGIIRRCAREFVERHGHVPEGAAAPATAAKAMMIEDGLSDERRAAREAATDIAERKAAGGNGQIAITLEEFHTWHAKLCRARGWPKFPTKRLDEELRRAGLFIRKRDERVGVDHRVLIGGRKMAVATNFDPDALPNPTDAIRTALTTMHNLGYDHDQPM